MKKIKYFLVGYLFLNVINANAQNPAIRKVAPVRQTTTINNPNIVRQTNIDTIPKPQAPLLKYGKVRVSVNNLREVKRSLQFQLEEAGNREFEINTVYKPTAPYGIKEWTLKMAWWNDNPAIQYGRVEISSLPFPPFETKDFSGILQTYIIKAPQKDSAIYDITYSSLIDNKDAPLGIIKKLPAEVKTSPIKVQINKGVIINQNNNPATSLQISEKIKNLNLVDIKSQPTRQAARNVFANNYQLLAKSNNLIATEGGTTFHLNNQLLTSLFNLNTDSVNYYIRIVPLGGRQMSIANPTNTIVAKWDATLWGYNHPKPTCYPVSHKSDYTVTNIEYTPAHFPERNCTYSNDAENIDCKNCVVVAIITDQQQNEDLKKWGLGVNIGDKICPAKKKESWYEKVIGSTANFVKNTVNGASNLYNDAKNYAKDNVKNVGGGICGDPCAAIAGYAFDAAMVYCGIPPSIPNMDELTDKGLDYAVELAAEQVGVPCDDICKDLVKKGMKDAVKQSSEKNFVNVGWYTVKPDPRGFYRNPYMIVTVKKTSNNTYKNKYACGEEKLELYIGNDSYLPNTKANEIISSQEGGYTTTNQTFISGSIFERVILPLPFNNETPIGTEIKIVIVLTPRLMYVWEDEKNKGKALKLDNFAPSKYIQDKRFLYNYNLNAQFMDEWQYAYKTAPVKFSFGKINVAPNVQTTITNPAYTSRVYWDDILD